MKQSLFSLLLLFSLAFGAAAQQATVTDYPSKKGINMMQADRTRVLADDGKELVMVAQTATGIITTYKDFQVLACDKAGNYRTVDLPDTRDCDLLVATYTEGNVYLLFASDKKNQFVISRAVVNVASMKVTTPPTPLYSENLTKSDIAFSRVSESPNRDFVGLAYGVFVNATKEVQTKQVMFDNTLEELWNKRYPLGVVDAVLATDDGQLATLNYAKDQKNNRTKFRFGILDVDGDNMEEVTVDAGNIVGCRLLNYIHGKFVVAGLLTDGTGYQHNTMYSGFCGIAYDSKRREATMHTHLLTADEVNVLENNSFKTRTKDLRTGGLTPMAVTTTDFGGALVLSRIYSVTTYGGKTGTSTEYYLTGSLAAAIDTNGAIVWQKPFRAFYKESEYMFFFHTGLFSQGSTVYVVQSENEKNGVLYDVATPVKKKGINGYKARTAVYAIDIRGTVSKEMHGEPSKQKLTGVLGPVGKGKYAFVTSMINQTSLHTIEIK